MCSVGLFYTYPSSLTVSPRMFEYLVKGEATAREEPKQRGRVWLMLCPFVLNPLHAEIIGW